MTLPVLLSIPHGGDRMPSEVQDIACISRRDIFGDSDPYTLAIYDMADEARCTVNTQIARCFVDVNRSLQSAKPISPDGLIKSYTSYNVPVYGPDVWPDDETCRTLIKRYYMPYHRRVQRLLHDEDIQLCLDCHSMAANPPPISTAHTKSPRPLFCLSNCNGQSSPEDAVSLLAECMSKSFGVDPSTIHINTPFQGGHITSTYGMNPYPWIQVEMNRSMYLSKEWFDVATLQCSADRLHDLNEMFVDAIRMYFGRL